MDFPFLFDIVRQYCDLCLLSNQIYRPARSMISPGSETIWSA